MQNYKKPKKPIASICVVTSIFKKNNKYEILTLENLLKQAKKETAMRVYENVAVWIKMYSIIGLWGKTCLILDEI